MTVVALSVIMALVWATATGAFTLPNLLLGFVFALAALWLVRFRLGRAPIAARAGRILGLAGLFLWELLKSAISVALLVLTPNLKARLRPGFIAFPLTAKSDVEITLLANLITLTPGTLSVDVSADRSVLYIHAISVSDKAALIASIASGFEKRIIEVFK